MFRLMLLCDYTREPERRLLKGLSDFAATTGGWAYFQIPPELYSNQERRDEIIEKARELKADAIFGRWAGASRALADELGIPVVLRAGGEDYHDLPMLGGKYRDIGSMAAELFLSRHFTSFAFIGYKGLIWSQERWEGFSDRLAEADFHAERHETILNKIDESTVKVWLRALPRPVALFAANDVLALRVTEFCQELGLRIPEDVSLLGVDNDEFLCNISHPPVSSINLDFEKQGYELGSVLYEMHKQGRIWPARIEVEPIGLVERESMLRHIHIDPYVKTVVERIDRQYLSDITLKEITEDIPLSRRSLEIKFKQEMAPHTMLSYLTQLRIDHMCHLLCTTDLSISLAAEKSGFSDPINVGRIFKRYTGMTPTRYRKQAASGAPHHGDTGDE